MSGRWSVRYRPGGYVEDGWVSLQRYRMVAPDDWAIVDPNGVVRDAHNTHERAINAARAYAGDWAQGKRSYHGQRVSR